MAQKIVPNLWFEGNAREAVDYYLSVFKDAPDTHEKSVEYYPASAEEGLADFQLGMAGKVLTIEFELAGMHFVAINAGPEFKFSEAVSFAVSCKDQAEIDYYWSCLSAVPESEQCGWCKDKYGLSWQIVPENMEELMRRPGAFAKLMEMHKIEIDKF